MDLLNKKGKIFLTGIGGIGMSGIAEILHNLGYEVSGSDIKAGSNVRRLKKIGIKIKIGHNEDNIIGISLLVAFLNCSIKSPIKIKNAKITNVIKNE